MKTKITKNIDADKLELLIHATYYTAFMTALEGKSITHPNVKKEIDRLKSFVYTELKYIEL